MTLDSYLDVLTYFYSYARYNPDDISGWSLERLRKLLDRLGNPHRQFPSLLIAGTKGKGSTAAICESILRQAGYKTGLYTSPHLHSFRERIRVRGELISEAQLIRLARQLKPYFESTPNLTAFELITIVAFMAFAEVQVEAAVLEVGLGGRLDATNAVDPTVAVITSISYDHTQILGDTLSLIAREKAGIIRPGALVISAPQFDEAMAMIEQVCQEHQARLVVVNRDWEWTVDQLSLEGQTLTVCEQPFRLPLIGEHQAINAITAMAATEGFQAVTGLPVPGHAYQTGLANVSWPGRMEILHRRPYVVADSAMNGHSAEKLVQTLKRYFTSSRLIFIFGISYDHPVTDMLEVLLPEADQIFVTAARHPRAEDPEKLAVMAAELGQAVTPTATVGLALEQALQTAGPNDLICTTGSLFLVAELREAWFQRRNLPLPPVDPMVLF